jgi:hypothetical protein
VSNNPFAASDLQQPPPEEAEPKPEKPVLNPIQDMAWRLCAANTREARWRQMRVNQRNTRRNLRPAYTVKARWHDIARIVISEGIDNPERFIHAQFLYSGKHGKEDPASRQLKMTYVANLRDEELVDHFRKYDAKADVWLEQDLQSCGLRFSVFMGDAELLFPGRTDQELWKIVLRNKMYDLSPLFRYALAVSEGFMGLATEFHDEALEQLLADPMGYSRTWSKVLPQALMAEVETILTPPVREEQ